MNSKPLIHSFASAKIRPCRRAGLLVLLAALPWSATATADTYQAPAPYERTIRLDAADTVSSNTALPPAKRRACINESAIAANHRNRPGRVNTIGLCDENAAIPAEDSDNTIPVQELTESSSEEVDVQSGAY